VYGKVSAWAKADVGTALYKNWIPEQSDYTVVARRSMLVNASYAVYLEMNPGQNPEREVLQVESVVPASSTTVQVKLKVPVSSVSKGQFSIVNASGNTLIIQSAALNSTGNVITLTTNKHIAGTVYRLSVEGRTWSFTALSGDLTKPKISSSKINADASIDVVFSEPVDAVTATNTANYQFNNGLVIRSISLSSDKKKVTILTVKQASGTLYTLSVNNVKDLAGNVMDAASGLHFGAVVDNSPPVITKIAAGTNKVVLTFNEKLDPLYAGNPVFYNFDGGLGLPIQAVYKAADLTVTLTTGGQISGRSYKLTVNAIRDLSGNVIAETQRSFYGNGSNPAATLLVNNILPVNENTVDVYFSQPLTGVNLSGLKLTVLTRDGANISTSGWRYYLQRKPGADHVITFQIRTSDDGNPSLFRPGHVYTAAVSGITGLNTSNNANKKLFAGTEVLNPQPYAATAVAVNNRTVTVYFSEPVKNVSASFIRISDSDGNPIAIASDQLQDKSKVVTQVTLNLGKALEGSKTYRMGFVSGITDAAGWNGLKTKEGTGTYHVIFGGTDTAG
ncbi:Ig-like domain-containing protein, partial [Paenibacillus sepulcri]|nr:Ig-like domain-containing protein [Paenibacillus sepulcri]